MTQKIAMKIVLALVAIGLLVAGYMAFFAGEKAEDMDEVVIEVVEEPALSTGVTIAQTEDSEYFATKEGMALYTFANDEFNKSNCTGGCLDNWPVFYSAELLAADGFGTITRDDGAPQSTYLEKPLYTFYKDELPGDTNGHGVNDVWFLATFSK